MPRQPPRTATGAILRRPHLAGLEAERGNFRGNFAVSFLQRNYLLFLISALACLAIAA